MVKTLDNLMEICYTTIEVGNKHSEDTEKMANKFDKSYRLVCVDFGINANKFWFCDVEDSLVHRNWGRVGSRGQKRTDDFGTPAKAMKFADKKAAKQISEKNYRHASVLVDDEIQVQGMDLKQIALQQINTNGYSAINSLISFLADANVHTITAGSGVTVSNGTLKTALGIITKEAIADARILLDRISGYVRRKLTYHAKFKELVQEYLILVPNKGQGRTINPVDIFCFMSDVKRQRDVLDAMETFLDNAAAMASGNAVFDMSITPATASEITDLDKKYRATAKSMHQSFGKKIKNAWRIEIADDKFDASVGNVKELWHGTKASNLLAIFTKGLRIIKKGSTHITGRMFGDGLYFSDQSTKALNYATNYWSGGGNVKRTFMLLCEVAMGNTFTPGYNGSNLSYPMTGYDSTTAVGGKSGVQNNEMIVYKENQARIKYLVEFS